MKQHENGHWVVRGYWHGIDEFSKGTGVSREVCERFINEMTEAGLFRIYPTEKGDMFEIASTEEEAREANRRNN